MDSEPFRIGSFGKIYHGKWLGSRVIVKRVDLVSTKIRYQSGLFICEEAGNGTLRDYLFNEREAGISPPVWRVLHDAALGLRFLHERGIVHGDLKGNNILVNKAGVAMLTDFGLSTFPGREGSSSIFCGAIGAYQWKAPELLGGDCSASTFESDVYAFGMCIVEALRGGLPWGTLHDAAVKYSLLKTKQSAAEDGFCETISCVLPRPVNVTNDKHWALVKQLCAFERSERLKLPDAIEIIEQFALDEAMEESLECTESSA